jgi:GNAT superfamily N-acetyltransferase
LEGLWVSHGYRGKGVGKTLFQMAALDARSRSAKVMVVLSKPSEITVHFCQILGCQYANPMDPTLFEKELEDIHLELVL